MGAKNLYKLTVVPVFPSVPLSRCLGMGQWDKCRFLGTGGRTDMGQLDLKSLANNILQRDNARDKNGTITRKIVSRSTSKNNPLSHAKTPQKTLLQSCIYCDFWQTKRGSVWWCGVCALNGQRISHKGKCHLGLWRWNNG